MSEVELRDKVALVTGGASGLGRATAVALAEAGAEVVVADVQEEAGREVAEQLGGHFVRTDVSKVEDDRAMVDLAVERCGGLDLVYLNAGVNSECSPVDPDFDLDKYRRIMGVNIDGVVYGTHAALPALRERGGGAIVATASLAGLLPMALDPIYTATKHAVVGFGRSMGLALAQQNIRFNVVCPGFSESALIDPIRDFIAEGGFPIIPAEEVAETVLTLFAGDQAGECWFVQANRAGNFEFRNVPGPRVEPKPA